MLLRYFFNQPLAHASYLVGCQATGEAIVIDPGRDLEPYLNEAEAQGLRLVAATVINLLGGINNWRAEGLPVEREA